MTTSRGQLAKRLVSEAMAEERAELLTRLAEKEQQLDRWAKFSERHGWLDPEDFDGWIAYLQTRLASADYLIKELCDHEGAEGWSEYLTKALDEYLGSAKPQN